MTQAKKSVIALIGLAFVTSLIVSNDFTLFYFLNVILLLASVALFFTQNLKKSFILSSTLIVVYSYQLGMFCRYFLQNFMPEPDSAKRILGYAAMGTLPFLFLSLVSIWFIYKSVKTKKNAWYIPFIGFMILLSPFFLDEGYGSNYLFKITLIAFNILSFSQMKTVTYKI